MFKLLICFAILAPSLVCSQSKDMVLVKEGTYLPLYGTENKVKVEAFLMDIYPVTNKEFLKFVKQNPQWRRSQVKKIFADKSYLHTWKDDVSLGKNQLPNSPVTNVSWYAAKSYCECQGKRLPTIDEWEYVARANENLANARKEASYNQYILNWYETPHTYNNLVGSTFKNYWGVYDLHGLVWEWTSDFNSIMTTGESRRGGGGNTNRFCGGAAAGATDLMNYAAFMRYALRGSLKADYSIKTLGFRCVKEFQTEKSI